MKEIVKGKELSCFENFGEGNCDCCIDALDCETRTFRMKNGITLLEKRNSTG